MQCLHVVAKVSKKECDSAKNLDIDFDFYRHSDYFFYSPDSFLGNKISPNSIFRFHVFFEDNLRSSPQNSFIIKSVFGQTDRFTSKYSMKSYLESDKPRFCHVMSLSLLMDPEHQSCNKDSSKI